MCCSVNVSVCFVCCVLDSVCELFGETIRNVCGCILLLNVMDVFSVITTHTKHIHNICMTDVIFLFRSLRAGSQVFALLMLFL